MYLVADCYALLTEEHKPRLPNISVVAFADNPQILKSSRNILEFPSNHYHFEVQIILVNFYCLVPIKSQIFNVKKELPHGRSFGGN